MADIEEKHPAGTAPEWIARCAHRIAAHWQDVNLSQASAFALELSLDERLRARAPEQVADDLTDCRLQPP